MSEKGKTKKGFQEKPHWVALSLASDTQPFGVFFWINK